MPSDEDEARIRLVIHHVGREIDLRGRLLAMERELRSTTNSRRRRQLSEGLIACRADLADNDTQLAWLRGELGDHTTH